MIRVAAKHVLKAFPRLRRWVKGYLARKDGYPDWKALLAGDWGRWQAATASAKGGAKILVATSVGGYLTGNALESTLSVALTLRGAEVHVLLCDEALPACLESTIAWYPKVERFSRFGPQKDLCRTCYPASARMYEALGLKIHRYSEWVKPEERALLEATAASVPFSGISGYQWEGLKVGEHALAGALRFFARGDLEAEPQAEAVLRRYFRAALLTACAARNLMRAHRFEAAVFHHGIYVPQGLIGEAARKENVRVLNWNPAYRKRCFIFSHGDTYHHTLMSEPTSHWEDLPWNDRMERELKAYLKSRWSAAQDWIWFHERKSLEDPAAIARELGVDFSKPCIGLLTNVMWDAQLHYPANAFPNMLEWVLKTIAYFAKRPDVQLVIRVHPAEIRGTLPSRQPIVPEIRKAFPTLPRNVFVIGPESPISTYATMTQCNAVIIYGTKTGVELTSLGIPVIVAGEAWIRNKGITKDAKDEAHYFTLLDELPLPADRRVVDTRRALKYAYHFFFRRMIPLSFLDPRPGDPPFRVRVAALSDLAPGTSKGLDVICDAILKNAPCLYPAELEHGVSG